MKKVCIVTATRSEYGALRWLIDEVHKDNQLLLQLVVTGTHLSPEFGLTYTEIELDGYQIEDKVDILLSASSNIGVVKTMGVCSIGFADTFNRLKPDLVVVLGDRYELLPICGAALVLNIPMAHISGGDVTEGAIDDQVRNAVTMMATLHFPGVEESAKRIERMRGTAANIYTVGEPGLDNFLRLKLWDRQVLANSLSLDISKRWVLLTYHPETKLTLDINLVVLHNIIQSLCEYSDLQIVMTGANSDYGGYQINEILQKLAFENTEKFKFIQSLGQLRYLSIMKEIDFLIGNSSSAIIEAPFLGKSVINIGDRQKGRYLCQNIRSVNSDLMSIKEALVDISSGNINISDRYYYGTGNASENILYKIKEYLLR